MSSELSEILASVNNTKEHLYADDPDRVKSYPPYIINRCLSGHVDSILFANAMNLNQHLDKRLQYDFLLNTLRKRKRFTPWLKKEQVDDLDLVKKHYDYSNEKAKIALSLLTKTQIEYIRNKHEKGGRR
jgi:hypothetical protein|tara:strand:- start:1413 stop:1799 length:387 start_codon:yes stop_codon:yes gene_type:complete